MREGDVNNGVLAAQDFLDCDLQSAVDIVGDLVNVHTRQDQRLIAEDLPLVAQEIQLDGIAVEQLDDYVLRLQQWIAGYLACYLGDPPLRRPRARTGRISCATFSPWGLSHFVLVHVRSGRRLTAWRSAVQMVVAEAVTCESWRHNGDYLELLTQ